MFFRFLIMAPTKTPVNPNRFADALSAQQAEQLLRNDLTSRLTKPKTGGPKMVTISSSKLKPLDSSKLKFLNKINSNSPDLNNPQKVTSKTIKINTQTTSSSSKTPISPSTVQKIVNNQTFSAATASPQINGNEKITPLHILQSLQ